MDLTWDDESLYGTSQRSRPSRTPSAAGAHVDSDPETPAVFRRPQDRRSIRNRGSRIVNRDAKFWKHAGDQSLDVPDGLPRVIERAFNSAQIDGDWSSSGLGRTVDVSGSPRRSVAITNLRAMVQSHVRGHFQKATPSRVLPKRGTWYHSGHGAVSNHRVLASR
jgi:hypothetical protein